MKKYLIASLWVFLWAASSIANAQSEWSPWIKVFDDGAYPTPHIVQVSYKMAPICNQYSFYRTKSDFSIQYGTVSFYFDYLDCDGNTQNELVTVELDKPQTYFSVTGDWFIGSKVTTEFRDVKFYQPKTPGSTNNNSANSDGTSDGILAGSVTPEQNRNKAIELKTDMDTTRISFNNAFISAYSRLSNITDTQQRQQYIEQLDSCKSAFISADQESTQYYKTGNGQQMNKSLVVMHNVLNRTRYYISLMGDLIIREKQGVNSNNIPANNNQVQGQTQTNKSSNSNQQQATTTNANTDAIQQALQLNQAKINQAYNLTHRAASATMIQPQVNNLQQQQNIQTTQNATNTVTGVLGILAASQQRKAAEQQQEQQQLNSEQQQKYAYLNGHNVGDDFKTMSAKGLDSLGEKFMLAQQNDKALSYYYAAVAKGDSVEGYAGISAMYHFILTGAINNKAAEVEADLYLANRITQKGRACDQQKYLAIDYENGWGVEKNYSEAVKWYGTYLEAEIKFKDRLKKENINWSQSQIDWWESMMEDTTKAVIKLYKRGGYGLEKNKDMVEKWSKFYFRY